MFGPTPVFLMQVELCVSTTYNIVIERPLMLTEKKTIDILYMGFIKHSRVYHLLIFSLLTTANGQLLNVTSV